MCLELSETIRTILPCPFIRQVTKNHLNKTNVHWLFFVVWKEKRQTGKSVQTKRLKRTEKIFVYLDRNQYSERLWKMLLLNLHFEATKLPFPWYVYVCPRTKWHHQSIFLCIDESKILCFLKVLISHEQLKLIHSFVVFLTPLEILRVVMVIFLVLHWFSVSRPIELFQPRKIKRIIAVMINFDKVICINHRMNNFRLNSIFPTFI